MVIMHHSLLMSDSIHYFKKWLWSNTQSDLACE